MEETYKEYKISYDENSKEFKVSIGDSHYQNSKLASVKKYIDRLDTKDFDRVDVIVDDWRGIGDAVVTSYPKHQSGNYQECWVSYKDKSAYHSRSKLNIKHVYLDNLSNREILAKMKEKEDEIKIITEEIARLKESLETYKPIKQ